jgi:hypothetical protein
MKKAARLKFYNHQVQRTVDLRRFSVRSVRCHRLSAAR